VQLIDRHLHGGLIHFGVHGSGCLGGLGGRWLLARCTGLGSALESGLGLGGGEGCRASGPKSRQALQLEFKGSDSRGVT
jgi:hypothetical protein